MMKATDFWYELQGDYYIPCLTLPTEKKTSLSAYGEQRHKRYLQECKKAVYITLLTSGRLNSYLADIDEQATEMMFRLVEQMADKEGVTEQLKTERPMLWGWQNKRDTGKSKRNRQCRNYLRIVM